MSYCFNSKFPAELYMEVKNAKYFVDKTFLLSKLNSYLQTDTKYLCITRPRRFGKTVMADMIASYYTKGIDGNNIFSGLDISKESSYLEHLNKHNVIFIDFSQHPDEDSNYKEYIQYIKNKLLLDLKEYYPKQIIDTSFPIHDILSKISLNTGDRFIFILDEWDSVFHENTFSEADQKKFLRFLKNLLKDKAYIEMVYMTGILPIAKYSSGSELNMFREYNFMNDKVFDTYFGFTEEEVKDLCLKHHKVSFQELKEWYNGYLSASGINLYNPRSVKYALIDGVCQSYWTQTGPFDEISYYIHNNIEETKESIVKMISSVPVEIKLTGFGAEKLSLETKEEIFAAMVVYGFLGYYNNKLFIPNRELMMKFEDLLKKKEMGYISSLVLQSEKMLEATISQDVVTMCEILEYTHNTEIPILQYNDENSLSCIINLVYLSARNYYRMEREEKSGIGFADFIFYPLLKEKPAIILELKKDSSPEIAIQQIIDKKYYLKLSRSNCRILAVGINYETKGLHRHECKVVDITDYISN